MQNILTWLKSKLIRPTGYPPPVLSGIQLRVLDALDLHLSGTSSGFEGSLNLACLSVTLMDQMRGETYLTNLLLQNAKTARCYIPRSIALVTGADGTWHFVIGYRETEGNFSQLEETLFLQALNLTNCARAKEM